MFVVVVVFVVVLGRCCACFSRTIGHTMEDIYVPMNQEEATSSDEDEVEEDDVQQDDDLVDEDPSDAEISHVVRLWFG